MRALLLSLTLGLLGGSLTPPLARATGAYVSVQQSNTAACARSCADDGLCLAWILREGATCALTANVPLELPADTVEAGLAHRAPAFAVLPAIPLVAPTSDAAPVAEPDNDPAYALLGGPEDSALRQHLRVN